MSANEAKAMFRTLSKTLHPDKGGSAEEFRAMMSEYESFLQFKGSSFEKSKEEASAMWDFIKEDEFFSSLDDVTVELTGSWIWVSGNTFPHKDSLSAHGFRWSKTKEKWYKSPNPLTGKRKRGTDFERIKNTYGYDSIKIEKSNNRLSNSK